MSLTNPFGDFEITDPKAMRALAHPTRMAAMRQLQRHGPATATQLADVVGASPSVLSWHLRHLQSFGLVNEWDGGTDGRERWWQAVAKGVRFGIPAGAEGRAAFEDLHAEFLNQAVGEAQTWLADVAPTLDDVWTARSDGANTRLMVTPEEADAIGAAIEKLLTPYLASTREPAPGMRSVRMLRFNLPEAGDAIPGDNSQPHPEPS
jgi:DNA-binding transcriptional ArsR family regulator